MKNSTTLKTIARETGYSVTTVSRALAGYADVAAVTRERIVRAAENLGYYPNLAARQLQKRRSDTIGLILPAHSPDYSDPYFITIIAGIGNQLAAHNLDLLLSTHAPGGTGELSAYRRLVEGRRVDGLIVIRTRLQDERLAYLAGTSLPFVAFGRSDLQTDFPYIDEDGETGFYHLTWYLIGLGHTRIAYIAAPSNLIFASHRLRGYCRAMQEAGLPCHEEYIAFGDLSRRSGETAARRLLSTQPRPTAIIAANDLMAIGAILYARQNNLNVGPDVSIAGFDDISLAAPYSLTTLQQPIYTIGKQLAEMLYKLINGIPLENRHVLLTPSLVIRGSTSSPGVN